MFLIQFSPRYSSVAAFASAVRERNYDYNAQEKTATKENPIERTSDGCCIARQALLRAMRELELKLLKIEEETSDAGVD